jgi:hypothetical protein
MLSATLKIFQWALDFLRPTLMKLQRLPEVRFGSPEDLSTEPFLTWWHISVMVKVKRGWRGLVESADLEHGKVILIFEGPDRRSALPLLWQSLEGPKEYATKQVAKQPKTIPVVVRSEKDCLSPFALPAGVARVTDQSMLIHQRAFTDLEPGSYKMRLRVQSMGGTWDSQTFILSVPGPDTQNDKFQLSEIG